MTSIRTDAGHVHNAATTLLVEAEAMGADPKRAARLDALARLAAYALRYAGQVWIDLDVEDFLLLEPELLKHPA